MGRGYIRAAQVQKLLDGQPSIRKMELSNSGEPFCNPEMYEILRLLHERNILIQFWNGANIPTLSNYPANQWTTEADRTNHQADIYTVIQDVSGELKQGKSYRFDKVSGTWTWIELTDNELSAVQALAASKAKVYVVQPTPPYNVGDLWLNNNNLYKCKTAKAAGTSYAAADWELATDYTNDDTANQALNQIVNMVIGGRNLLLKTNQGTTNWTYSRANGTVTTEVDGVGVHFNVETASTSWQMVTYKFDNSQVLLLEPNINYVVSFDYKTNMGTSNFTSNVSVMQSNGQNQLAAGGKATIINDDSWHKATFVLTTNALTNSKTGQLVYITGFNKTGDLYLKNIKFEKGNKATDWTPAPEDISEEINDVNSNFSNYVTTEAYDSDWQTRKDEILGTVEGTYTTQSAFGTYQEQMSTALSMKADSATITATASAVVKNAISGIEDTVNDINETFTFDTNGLTIARGSNTMYLRLQNNRLSFKTDESETGERAYMTSNEFVLKELQSFQIGAFKFEVRTNGSLDFKKV